MPDASASRQAANRPHRAEKCSLWPCMRTDLTSSHEGKRSFGAATWTAPSCRDRARTCAGFSRSAANLPAPLCSAAPVALIRSGLAPGGSALASHSGRHPIRRARDFFGRSCASRHRGPRSADVGQHTGRLGGGRGRHPARVWRASRLPGCCGELQRTSHRFCGRLRSCAAALPRSRGAACATPTQRIAARICRSQLFGNRIKAS